MLRLADGSLLCGGASSDPVTVDHVGWPQAGTLTAADHARDLHNLARLTGWQAPVDPATLHGHTGWRLASTDRMPVIGPVPMANLPPPPTAWSKAAGYCASLACMSFPPSAHAA